MLQTEPSLSIYNQDFEEFNDGKLVKSVTIGNDIADIVISDDFSFGKRVMGLIEEDDNEELGEGKQDKERVLDGFKDNMGVEGGSEEVGLMYLASRFGINDNGIDNSGVVTPNFET